MKQNIHIQLAAEVVRALRNNPRQSNNELAQKYGISEDFVRRYRAVLELEDVLPLTDGRVGVDGVTHSMPSRV